MTCYMIWNKRTNQIVPTTFDDRKKAKETLKAMVPNLKHYGSLVSEGDFQITLRELMDWEIISFKPTGITGVQVSEIQKSSAWKEHCE